MWDDSQCVQATGPVLHSIQRSDALVQAAFVARDRSLEERRLAPRNLGASRSHDCAVVRQTRHAHAQIRFGIVDSSSDGVEVLGHPAAN